MHLKPLAMRLSPLPLLLLLLIAPQGVFAADDPTLQEALEEALTLLEEGELRAAEQSLTELLAIADDLAPAWAGLAALHGLRDDWDRSATNAMRARELDPDNPLAATLLCRAEVNRRRFSAASVACRDAIRLDAGEVLAWRGACTAATARHRWREAVEVCGAGAERFTEESALLWRLGVALGRVGRIEAGRHACERAIAAAPQDPMSHYCAGSVALEAGDARAALPSCERAVALDSTHALALFCRGMAHLGVGQPDVAQTDCEDAARRAPDEPLTHFCLGRIAHARQNWSETQAHMQRALAIQDDLPEVRGTLAEALVRGGDPESGERILRALVAEQDSPLRRAQLAGALQDLERWDEAIAQWEQALEAQPERAGWWSNLALAHYGKGDLEAFVGALDRAQRAEQEDPRWVVGHIEGALLARMPQNALEAATRGLESHPGDPRILLGQCQALVRLSRWEDAERACMRASADGERAGLAQRELGTIYLSTQRPAEAVEALRTALRRGTRDAATHTNLGNALLSVGDAEGALAALRSATEMPNASALSFHLLGRALEATGDAGESRRAYCRAASMAHDNARFAEACEGAR